MGYEGAIPSALPHTVESVKTVDPLPGNMTDHIIEGLNKEDMAVVKDPYRPVVFPMNSTDASSEYYEKLSESYEPINFTPPTTVTPVTLTPASVRSLVSPSRSGSQDYLLQPNT